MSEIKLRALLAETVIRPQIDIHGPIEDGIRKVLNQTILPKNPEITFEKTSSSAVQQTIWVRSFLGESVLDVITKMQNAFPIDLVVVPTSEGGFVLYLDEKEV